MNYKNCHKILKYLYDEWNENNQQETIIGSIKIATKTNIPIAEIHDLQHILINKGEVTFSGNDGQSMLSGGVAHSYMALRNFLDDSHQRTIIAFGHYAVIHGQTKPIRLVG